MKGWQDPAKKKVPGTAWKVENGALTTTSKPQIEEDLITEQSYGDFELKFDWRVAPGGNTGLKYRIQDAVFVNNSKKEDGPGGFEGTMGRELASRKSDRATLAPGSTAFVYTVAFEFQLIDDERHPDALRGPTRQTGALYSMIPATKKASRPAGEWNSSHSQAEGPGLRTLGEWDQGAGRIVTRSRCRRRRANSAGANTRRPFATCSATQNQWGRSLCSIMATRCGSATSRSAR